MDFRGNKYYFTLSDEEVPEEVKFKTKQKYPFKVLVWVAISEKGMSGFMIQKSRGAINSDKYIDILEQKLVPFISEH